MNIFFVQFFLPLLAVVCATLGGALIKCGIRTTSSVIAGVSAFLTIGAWTGRILALGFELVLIVPFYAIATLAFLSAYRRAWEEDMEDSVWFVSASLILAIGLLVQRDWDVAGPWIVLDRLLCGSKECLGMPSAVHLHYSVATMWNAVPLLGLVACWRGLRRERALRVLPENE